MKNKKFLLFLLPSFCLLSACKTNDNNNPIVDELIYYAYFMNNYPRDTSVSPNGFDERIDNSLYERKEIIPGVPFDKPDVDPERNNYEFLGWFKEKECLNVWNFTEDTTEETIFLYAKWGMTQSEEYMEPEYIYPEKIITDADFRLTGIFNTPVNANKVGLTIGAINRLAAHKDDVSFAIAYQRRENITFTASYDLNNKTINIRISNGEEINVLVEDITSSLSIASENSGFESKAEKYETLGTNYENYHIALAGSSSMENWTTSTVDMSPIISFNHGIGGTTVEQWTNKLFQRLVLPYLPKAVVYYVGVNNIINGEHETGEATGQKLVALFNKTHSYLPDTQIFYVLINRLPGYGNKQSDFDVANNYALEYAQSHDYLRCINAGEGLLKEDGLPNSAYFMPDGLHMSKYGYVIWGQAVKQEIIKWLDE